MVCFSSSHFTYFITNINHHYIGARGLRDALDMSNHSIDSVNNYMPRLGSLDNSNSSYRSGGYRDYLDISNHSNLSMDLDPSFMRRNSNLDSSTHSKGSLASVSHYTRHARRIYVGGIPPAYADEEMLTSFLNSVFSKGLGLENDNSYVLSMYINQKKCFAFVELNSIELTKASLELDGIVYRNSVLKILRANEYKPELVPPSNNPSLKLNLPATYFTSSMVLQHQLAQAGEFSPDINWMMNDSPLKICAINEVENGAIAIIGFPYDEGSRRAGHRLGCANAPKCVRQYIRKNGFGSLVNPEYGIDCEAAKVLICDVGDVPLGLPIDTAQQRLTAMIAELLQQGAIPFIIGGSSDQCYHNIIGLMAVSGGQIGVLNINSTLGVKQTASSVDSRATSGASFRNLLDDPLFCPPRNGLASKRYCDNRFVVFGAQGTVCNMEHDKYITDRGGKVLWLNRDIRSAAVSQLNQSSNHFKNTLQALGRDAISGYNRPIALSLDISAINVAELPGQSNPNPYGLSVEEISEMAMIAGSDPNVAFFDISEINTDVEEIHSSRVISHFLYKFALGTIFSFQIISTSNTTTTRGCIA